MTTYKFIFCFLTGYSFFRANGSNGKVCGFGRFLADTVISLGCRFCALGTQLHMITAADARSASAASRSTLVPVHGFSMWKIADVIAFLERCLDPANIRNWVPFAAQFRGPPRNIFEAILPKNPDFYGKVEQSAAFKRIARLKQKDLENWLERTSGDDDLKNTSDKDNVNLLRRALLAVRCPSPFAINLGLWQSLLPTGLLLPLQISSLDPPEGMFAFAEDPALTVGLTSFLKQDPYLHTSLGECK